MSNYYPNLTRELVPQDLMETLHRTLSSNDENISPSFLKPISARASVMTPWESGEQNPNRELLTVFNSLISLFS